MSKYYIAKDTGEPLVVLGHYNVLADGSVEKMVINSQPVKKEPIEQPTIVLEEFARYGEQVEVFIDNKWTKGILQRQLKVASCEAIQRFCYEVKVGEFTWRFSDDKIRFLNV